MDNEALLRAMGVKPKVTPEIKEEVKSDISPLGMDDIEIPVPKRENPSTLLDVHETTREKDTTFSHRDPKAKVSLDDLMVSMIAQQRRTNSLLEQLRSIALGMPISESTVEVNTNGER